MSFEETEKFDIVEVEVPEAQVNKDEIHRNLDVVEEGSRQRTRRRRKNRLRNRGPRKKKYHWAFFLASMFIGIGITATLPTEPPMGVLGGIGIGFLFFVDPIHDKVINWLENL